MGAAAVLAYPSAKVLGANDRVRVGMIGVGDRGNDLLNQIRGVSNVELVAMADIYSRRRDQAKSKVPGIQTFSDYRRLLDMKDIDGSHRRQPAAHPRAPFRGCAGRRQGSLFREDDDLVDPRSRQMLGRGQGFGSRGADRIAA